MALVGGEQLICRRVVDDAHHQLLVDGQTHGNAAMWDAVDEIGGAIDGINDPGGRVRQFRLAVRGCRLLLTND